MSYQAVCPQCNKPMRYNPAVQAWDCGPEDEGGHGFWDPELQDLEYRSDKVRWSEALTGPDDVGNYGVPVGSLAVWAGDADDAGHVEEDEIRFLKHDAVVNKHGVVLYGPETQAWVEASVAEMLADIAESNA